MDKGETQGFFNIFNTVPQESSQVNNFKNLEFYLRVYFAIYPCHQATSRQLSKDSTSKYKKNMEEFKEYLDLQGPNFSKSEEVL